MIYSTKIEITNVCGPHHRFLIINNMNISLVGLPSSGKSSIINSLTGKRVAQSGVSRTTIAETLYQNLKSDDNIDFNIYDLPGIADIEDIENKFDNLIKTCIIKSDLVIWVTDITKAFITNHEETEFTKIMEHILNLKLTKGLSIQLIIMLSKVDQSIEQTEKKVKEVINVDTNNIVNVETLDELVEITGDEDTTINDIYMDITNKFAGIDVICYNAFGKSLYGPLSSNTLKEFAKKYNPTSSNILFNLKKYFDIMPGLKNSALYDHCIKYSFRKFFTKPFCDDITFDNKGYMVSCVLDNNHVTVCCCEYCMKGKYKFKCIKHGEDIINPYTGGITFNNSFVTNRGAIACQCKLISVLQN